jgi:PAS domain S-box-containing protein
MHRTAKDLIAIKDLLRRHPKGMSITEIGEALEMHRNTTARYLDILQFKGDVDIKRLGTSKNYYLVRRMPVAALLHFWPHPAVVLNARREVAMVNPAALELLGCPLDVLYGEGIEDLPFPLFQDPGVTERLYAALQGEPDQIVIDTPLAGREHRLRVQLIPVVFDTRAAGCALAFVDETPLRNAVAARERADQRYAALLADQREFVVHARPDLTLIFANDAFCRHTGRTPDEIRGYRFLSLLLAEDRERVRQGLLGLTPADPGKQLEVRSVRPDGTIGTEAWTFRGITGERGRITGYHGVGRDITECAQLKDQLQRYHTHLEATIRERTQEMQEANRDLVEVIAEKEQLERELLFTEYAFDHASDSILLFDRKGRIYKANETACDLLGYPREEITRITVFEVNPSITPRSWERMWADARHGMKQRVVSVHKKKNGLIFDVDVARTFVEYGGTMYFCSIAREVPSNRETAGMMGTG